MKTLIKIAVVLVLLGGGCVAAFAYLGGVWKARNQPQYRQAEVTRGDIEWVINCTGSVRPVLNVPVGSFVSGPIISRSKEEMASSDGNDEEENEWPLLADFNQVVKKGDLLAKIDPRTFQAAVDRDAAALKTREAEQARVFALLEQSQNDEQRALELQKQNTEDVKYISDMEVDKYVYARKSLEAQLEVAEAAVDQADCNLRNTKMFLDYTNIVSPVSGIIIDRKIDPGQTLAAQFQTPELFFVAPDMEREMHVEALVSEADIGLIIEAHEKDNPVRFTVDAYRDDLFDGTIYQVRLGSAVEQNVVTYPVVVSAPNPEMKLLPGMTANLSFHINEHKDVLRIPNAALRFYPKPEQVRPQDRKLLEEGIQDDSEEEMAETDVQLSAMQKYLAAKKRNRRHVWVVEGSLLRAVEVTTGLSDYKYTELVSGKLEEGQKLVVPGKPVP